MAEYDGLVYVLNDGGNGNVAGFRNNGGGGGAGDLAIAGHGRSLSILALRTPAVLSFSVGADGSLTPAMRSTTGPRLTTTVPFEVPSLRV